MFDSLFFGPILAVGAQLFVYTFNRDGSNRARVTRIDPTRLTEAGRDLLPRAFRNERIMYGWIAAGSALLLYAGFYFRS